MNEDRALEQQFLDRAKALTNVAEVFRCLQVTMLICDMVAFGVRAEAKIFEAAYGEPSGQKYWDAHLSEPIEPSMFFYFQLYSKPKRSQNYQ